MEFDSLSITPFIGVGHLRFGLCRSEVRTLLGRPSERWRRSTWSRNLTDRYEQWWMTLDYSDSDELEFIEVGRGRCSVLLGDVQLMPGRAREVVDRLGESGVATCPSDSGFSIVGAGVNLYVPSAEGGAVVEAVSATSSAMGEMSFSFFGEPAEAKVAAWPVEAGGGIADVRFGQLRSEVRLCMGEGMCSTIDGMQKTDHYWAEGLVVTFDADDRVVEVFALAPAKPTMGGVEVLGRSYDVLRGALVQAGFSVCDKPAELYVVELGASVWWSSDSDSSLPSIAVAMRKPELHN